jgi:hypothetical protein
VGSAFGLGILCAVQTRALLKAKPPKRALRKEIIYKWIENIEMGCDDNRLRLKTNKSSLMVGK